MFHLIAAQSRTYVLISPPDESFDRTHLWKIPSALPKSCAASPGCNAALAAGVCSTSNPCSRAADYAASAGIKPLPEAKP